MSKKGLIISTSPRKGSNSDALAEEFAKGTQNAGQRKSGHAKRGMTAQALG